MLGCAQPSNASAGSMRGYDRGMDIGPQVKLLEDTAALAEAAATMIVETAVEAVRARGRFTIALAGGATPRATYEKLAATPMRDLMPWDATWVFFGDERAVPPDHRESNFRMAHEAMLSRVPLPEGHVLRIRAEAEDRDAAAAEYAESLRRALGLRRGQTPALDLILLGMGVDGHTASLFPHSPALKEVFRPVVAVHAAAAAIPGRITLTLPVINAAGQVAFLVSGSEKAKAVRAVLQDGALVPAALVRPTSGALLWMLDRAAAALIPPQATP